MTGSDRQGRRSARFYCGGFARPAGVDPPQSTGNVESELFPGARIAGRFGVAGRVRLFSPAWGCLEDGAVGCFDQQIVSVSEESPTQFVDKVLGLLVPLRDGFCWGLERLGYSPLSIANQAPVMAHLTPEPVDGQPRPKPGQLTWSCAATPSAIDQWSLESPYVGTTPGTKCIPMTPSPR